MWLNESVQARARVCVIEFARFENHPWRLSASVDLVFGTAMLHTGAEAIRRLRSFSRAQNGPYLGQRQGNDAVTPKRSG